MKHTMLAAVVEASGRLLTLRDRDIARSYLRPNSCQDQDMRGLSRRSSPRTR